MPTKGASLCCGNTNGAHHKGEPSENINYAWAKDFNRGGIKQHFEEHGKEFIATSERDYAAKAVHFANSVDKQNYKSVIDYNGTTYKYNTKNNELVVVDKKGYVITYYRPDNGKFKYSPKKGIIKWIKIKNK